MIGIVIIIIGATTLMFESLPTYPDAGRYSDLYRTTHGREPTLGSVLWRCGTRYWDLVQRHKINSFYTAPTAIRALMKFGTEPLAKYDRSALGGLGTVGEPINPEASRWGYEEVSRKCLGSV